MERREFIEPIELRPTVERLAGHWSDAPPRFVRNFENAVYDIPASPRSIFLRLTPATHHSTAEVASELDFVRYLGDKGVACAQPVRSREGSLFYTAEVGDLEYTVCVFERAPGLAYEECPDVDQGSFFQQAGRLMAEVHAAGTRYRAPPGFRRFSWRGDRWNRFAELVPREQAEAWTMFEELMSWTATLPTDPRHFGMIHGDFTVANLRISDDGITLFDFDSCCAHWHAYEIAMFLHFFGARPALRELAYEMVLEGYAEVRPPDQGLIDQIPMFGKMRLLYSFLVFATEWGIEDLNEEQEAYFDHRRRLFGGPPLWPG